MTSFYGVLVGLIFLHAGWTALLTFVRPRPRRVRVDFHIGRPPTAVT